MSFISSFNKHFMCHLYDNSKNARHYISGLMQGGKRKNIERMEEIVADSDYQSMQQFISSSPWDYRSVMDHVACDADKILGGNDDSSLIIDESTFIKKGKKSVGVGRKWLGRYGKVDNGQVAVFAGLSSGYKITPIDTRLYLPKEWTDDKDRCRAAGIPEECCKFKTKHELALDVEKLGFMQGQRFWIERTFEDSKSQCGMADYQVRGWVAWHHHMALVMMAMLFMLNERILNKDTHPLLSCADIEVILANFLPRKNASKEEILRQLELRHRKRKDSIQYRQSKAFVSRE